jgi:hypothetical protein
LKIDPKDYPEEYELTQIIMKNGKVDDTPEK